MSRFLFLSLLVFVALTGSAQAGTFCVGTVGTAPQCAYEDVASCVRAAASAFSSCIINPDAVVNYWGGQRYCVIDSSRTAQCIYYDRSQCNREASLRSGICIDNASKPDDTDPYLYDNRVQR